MKDALAQQATDLASDTGANGGGGNESLAAELRESQKRCVLLEARLVQLDAMMANSNNSAPSHSNGDASNAGIINALSEVSAQLALCKAELAEANRTIEMKNQRIAELETEISQLQPAAGGLASDRVLGDAQVSELKRKLVSAENDIQRLIKERSQLMELSNQLRADLRKLKESGGGGSGNGSELKGPEFAGKKDYENLVAELSRSLEESRLHNKTLKKELRRMLKHQVISNQGSNYTPPPTDEDARRRTMSIASSNAATNPTSDGNTTTSKRRSSTLSMMKALDSNTSASLAPAQSDFASTVQERRPRSSTRASLAESVESSGSDFDAELLLLVRNKRPSGSGDDDASPSPFLERKRSSASSGSLGSMNPSAQQIRSASRPKSIPERDNEDEEDNEDDGENGNARRRMSSGSREEKRSSMNANGSKSALSSLFQRDRLDSMASNDESSTTVKVSDARLRLQQDILFDYSHSVL